MRKLIKIINSKILNPKKTQQGNVPKPERKFLNFMFRRQKLNQNINLKSFQNFQDYTTNTIFVTSNFEGTQFVIKQNMNSYDGIRQQDKNIENIHQNSIQKLCDQTGIPTQVQQNFHKLIKQINHIVRELYFQKKKLMEQKPFQFNISITLWILLIFVIGLVVFAMDIAIQSNINQNTKEEDMFGNILCGFILFLITAGFVNLLYSISRPYNFFNFDYEVIQKTTKKLMQQNKQFYHQHNYTIVCDIEMTWILLKPKNIISQKKIQYE